MQVLQDEEAVHKCLFKSHLMLETDELYFEPPQSEFKECISDILAAFQECALAFPNLIPDPFFHSFTRYLLHNHTALHGIIKQVYIFLIPDH